MAPTTPVFLLALRAVFVLFAAIAAAYAFGAAWHIGQAIAAGPTVERSAAALLCMVTSLLLAGLLIPLSRPLFAARR